MSHTCASAYQFTGDSNRKPSVSNRQLLPRAPPRADVVKQLPFSADRRVAGPLETQPGTSPFGVDAVMNAGRPVSKLGGRQRVDRRPAGPSQGSALIRVVNRGVALGACLVARITVLGSGLAQPWKTAQSCNN